MISSFRKSGRPGRGCHVPGSAPCAAPGDEPGRGRGHRRSQRRAEGKGWQPERGSRCQSRAEGSAPRGCGSQGAILQRTPTFHPRKRGGQRAGQLRNSEGGCGRWPGRLERPYPAGGPGPAEPRSRPALRRAVRAPGGVAVAARPVPELGSGPPA